MYIPKNIFQKSPPASRLMLSLTLNELYSVCGFARLSSPKPVSYCLIPVEIIQLSILHPRNVKRGSKCWPTVSGIKISERESYCEFSSDSRRVWRSNGKLLILHESFITHCNFI